MSIQLLPGEIILDIFRLVGRDFFRQDVGRLSICKSWQGLAWAAALEELDVSARSVEKIVVAMRRREVTELLAGHVKTVNIVLNGFEDWHTVRTMSNDPAMAAIDMWAVNDWTAKLNCHLGFLADRLSLLPKLQALRLEARREPYGPKHGLERQSEYLVSSRLIPFVWLSRLTSLDIDTAGTHVVGQTRKSGQMLCRKISAVLPTLRRLRYRACCVCSEILAAPGEEELVKLEEVIINLSLADVLGFDPSVRRAARCKEVPNDSFLMLKAEMESQAVELARRMRTPRLVRVLSHTLPGALPELQTFDAVSGRRMVIPLNAPWDADGREMGERLVEEELIASFLV